MVGLCALTSKPAGPSLTLPWRGRQEREILHLAVSIS
jgi:hypothetical protein